MFADMLSQFAFRIEVGNSFFSIHKKKLRPFQRHLGSPREASAVDLCLDSYDQCISEYPLLRCRVEVAIAGEKSQLREEGVNVLILKLESVSEANEGDSPIYLYMEKSVADCHYSRLQSIEVHRIFLPVE